MSLTVTDRSVGDIKFELNVVEPYFVSVAVHDKSRGVKVSEDFNFTTNWDTVISLMGGESKQTRSQG